MSFLSAQLIQAQTGNDWKGKQCAVSLTYDDAINADLNHVVPALDSLGLKGTFYLIGASEVVSKRLNEWRKVAANGHELGNHAMFHPCDGSKPGRSFVQPDFDLSKYTVKRAVAEIRQNNVLLNAIDGKTNRTFAYPCGDLYIGDSLFYSGLKNEFVGARGVIPAMAALQKIDLSNIPAYPMQNVTGEYMISLVKEAIRTHSLLVFLFHGVGGDHPLNVDLGEHSKLIRFLKEHESEIWTDTMVAIAAHIKQTANAGR